MSDTSTHYPEQSCIDERTRRATGTFQWLLENEHACGTHPIAPSNYLKVLMCGDDAFGRIAEDIEAAVDSIDLICWGFDPGMELVRSGSAWPRGQPYGSLLQAAAGRGVKVRLLVWYEAGVAAQRQNNMPGFTGDQREGYLVDSTSTTREDMARHGINLPPPVFGGSDGRTPEQLRHDYCVGWWRDVKAAAKDKNGKGTPIEWRTRAGNKPAVQRNLADEADKPSSAAGDYGGLAHEKAMIEGHATHHQKTILIDYAWEGGKKAVGYVMGLNSITDYWDTAEHEFDTPKREVDWARKTELAKALPKSQAVSRDPYHDYVCKVVGPALRGVHKNFVDAWKRAGGAARADDADVLPPNLAKRPSPYRAQIVRTQPEEADKTIKSTYFHAPQFARNYIYIENQYFFYEEWVRNLKEVRQKLMAGFQGAGKKPEDSSMLHLFVVIPWPEDDGMVPRTYDMVKSLGEADSMPQQNAAMQEQDKARKEWADYQAQRERIAQSHRAAGTNPAYELSRLPLPQSRITYDPVYDTAAKVQAPQKRHDTGELQGLGMKVVLARLATCNKGKPMPKPELNYRQVYIHSKLMLIDDAFFTVGSANLNVRSMAADSEINVASDDHDEARALRQKVWWQHARGFKKTDGGSGEQTAIANAFDHWQKLMQINKIAMKKGMNGEPLTGFLVPFEDKREVHFRHG
jgi:phosphatidylserine/phosphatidylglycerophosphate/cardiolipin synthase-like enzyme